VVDKICSRLHCRSRSSRGWNNDDAEEGERLDDDDGMYVCNVPPIIGSDILAKNSICAVNIIAPTVTQTTAMTIHLPIHPSSTRRVAV
jgi:hypothetical protein